MLRHALLWCAMLIALGPTAPQLCAQPNSDPQDKPRKVKREPDKAFIDWLKDVDPILTSAEREAWNKLKTNEEREQLVQSAKFTIVP